VSAGGEERRINADRGLPVGGGLGIGRDGGESYGDLRCRAEAMTAREQPYVHS
jgi:hypothetical protein